MHDDKPRYPFFSKQLIVNHFFTLSDMERNHEDEIELLNRLLELLHQAGEEQKCSSLQLVYVASGAQYVKTVNSQNIYNNKQKGVAADKTSAMENTFDEDTPLSALFLESHHKELRDIIVSWRPFLIKDDPSVDALKMNSFHFDFSKIIATHIYIDIGRLLHSHALVNDNMSLLASYLYLHSNLSNSQTTLYTQLRKYKKR